MSIKKTAEARSTSEGLLNTPFDSMRVSRRPSEWRALNYIIEKSLPSDPLRFPVLLTAILGDKWSLDSWASLDQLDLTGGVASNGFWEQDGDDFTYSTGRFAIRVPSEGAVTVALWRYVGLVPLGGSKPSTSNFKSMCYFTMGVSTEGDVASLKGCVELWTPDFLSHITSYLLPAWVASGGDPKLIVSPMRCQTGRALDEIDEFLSEFVDDDLLPWYWV